MKPILENTLHVGGITVLAILLTRFVIYDFSSLSAFTPMEKNTDFEMSDLYNAVEDNKAVHRLSSDVCVVGIDGCNREETLDVVNMLSAYQAAAIGLDIIFPWPHRDNSYLLSTLSTTPGLVCVSKVEQDSDQVHFHQIKSSFYESIISPEYGYSNLFISSPRDVVRRFCPYVLTAEGDSLYGLPAALAKQVNGARYEDMLARKKDVETIDFTSWEIPTYTAQELMGGVLSEESFQGKVVLIGDLRDNKDSYLTPLHGSMPGVLIHAYSLQTILSGSYIDTTPVWINWLIGILLCILLASLLMEARNRMSNVGNMFIRLAQVAIMYQLVVLGCKYFSATHTYMDFSPSLLMIGLCALSFDIWFGLYGLYNFVRNKISKK